MAITEQRLTLDEFLQLPEEGETTLEYLDGEVTEKVSPKVYHGTLQSEFWGFLRDFAGPRKLGMAFTETRATFGGWSPVPDVIFYTWDRLERLPSGKLAPDFKTPPDLAIEIVSPEQSVNAQLRKCLWYVENGVRIVLLVDPKDESVVTFRAHTSPVVLHGADRIDLSEVLPGFELTVQQLFDSLTPR